MEWMLYSCLLSSVFVRVFNLNVSQRISLREYSVSCLFNKSILKLLLVNSLERTNIRGILLTHFHHELDWLHSLAIFDIHPLEWSWNPAYLSILSWFTFESPFIFAIVIWVPNSKAHMILLPNIIVDNNFHTILVSHDSFTTHSSSLIILIGHKHKISESINTLLPIDLFRALLSHEWIFVLEVKRMSSDRCDTFPDIVTLASQMVLELFPVTKFWNRS